VRQTWGIGHVSDVLLGKASEKVVSAGHTALSTFGLLKEESGATLRGYIEQLVADGFLLREGNPYPVLRLTPAGAALLKGEGRCALYREAQPVRPRRARGRSTASYGTDPELFDALRDVRMRLARERGVPPYVIFHDTTLREMAERRPSTIDDLHGIYGVGARKADDFGDAFLEVIRTHRKPDA
jgi:ATP-dependent DNA helicase RecQ